MFPALGPTPPTNSNSRKETVPSQLPAVLHPADSLVDLSFSAGSVLLLWQEIAHIQRKASGAGRKETTTASYPWGTETKEGKCKITSLTCGFEDQLSYYTSSRKAHAHTHTHTHTHTPEFLSFPSRHDSRSKIHITQRVTQTSYQERLPLHSKHSFE